MEMLAEFIRKHPWWQWLTRTPFAAKMTKYALSSGIAFMLSNITFAVCYALGMGTTAPSIIAFFAAAIPNWIMNRRWAWQQTGRAPVKQIVAYAAVSAMVLLVTAFATGRTNHWVKVHHVQQHHGLRLLIVTGSFVLVTVVLFFAKFAIYEFLIFRNGRPGQKAAGSDRLDQAGTAIDPFDQADTGTDPLDQADPGTDPFDQDGSGSDRADQDVALPGVAADPVRRLLRSRRNVNKIARANRIP
jgi:putative flippase GtrA